MLLGGLLVKVDAQRPATLKGIAGNLKVQHKVQTIQPNVPILPFLDAETQYRLTGDLGRIAPKVAGTRGGAITRFQYVTTHAPRSRRFNNTPPCALGGTSYIIAGEAIVVLYSYVQHPVN